MPIRRIIPILVVCIAFSLVALFLASVHALAAQAAGEPAPLRAPQVYRCVKPAGGGSCFSTIQEAVNASADGDIIRVTQGTYYETVMVTKSIRLEGGWNTALSARDWDSYLTVVNAQGMDSVITFDGNISATIEGFELIEGDASGYLGWGGGILATGDWEHGGSITIRHNVITDNAACRHSTGCQGYGGGIMIYSNSSIIEYNEIISNVASIAGNSGGQGGGIVIWGYPNTSTISHNTILSNTALVSQTGIYGGGEGGGIWCSNGCKIVATGNELRGNVAAVRGEGYGGGLNSEGAYYDNQILSNTASITGTGYGGGVYAQYLPIFRENLVQGNVASKNGDGSGGGVWARYLQEATGNTIVNNYATRGGGVYYSSYHNPLVFNDNLVAHNWATGTNLADEDGGGGIWSEAEAVEITNNELINNTGLVGGGVLINTGNNYLLKENILTDNWSYIGAGMFVYSATGTIVKNQILRNNALWWGGGMYLTGRTSPIMDSNVVMSNTAAGYSGTGGGGIVVSVIASSRVTMTNHIIARNTTLSGNGGGVYCSSGSCALVHCTIAENKLSAGLGEGVRLTAGGGTNLLWNSIVVGHNVGVVVSGSALLDYNDYYNNTLHVSGASSGANSFHLDPLFLNLAAADYHLLGSSPLIDAGDSLMSTPLDFEGDPRLNAPEIGADEYINSHIYLPIMMNKFDTMGPH